MEATLELIDRAPVLGSDGLAHSVSVPAPADPPAQRRRWAALFSAAVSAALVVMVVDHFRHVAFGTIVAMVPRNPAFWLLFAGYYLANPACEWVIYRRLWRLPAAGFAALIRKQVSNELLLGYLGEAQFYAWARSQLRMTATPFGAIKDVTILSAFVGNVVTLAMLAFAWPLLGKGEIGLETHNVFASLGVLLVSFFAIMLFGRRLFSLPPADLRMIASMHFVRIVAQLGCAAALWHLVIPSEAYSQWFLLATLRMLVSRLPLVPNKDVVFAGMTILLLGHEADIANLMTMMAGLILSAHLVCGAVFGVAGVAGQLLPGAPAALAAERRPQ
jgi:hypothetical protein